MLRVKELRGERGPGMAPSRRRSRKGTETPPAGTLGLLLARPGGSAPQSLAAAPDRPLKGAELHAEIRRRMRALAKARRGSRPAPPPDGS